MKDYVFVDGLVPWRISFSKKLGVMSPQLKLQGSLSPHVTVGHKNLCDPIPFRLFPMSYDVQEPHYFHIKQEHFRVFYLNSSSSSCSLKYKTP